MKKKSDDVMLAQFWDCDERTIRRWRKAGAPLMDEPKRMRVWLSCQRTVPAGTLTLLQLRRAQETIEAAAAAQSLPEGLAALLKRQETEEARAFTRYKAAEQGGDAVSLKEARQHWQAMSKALLPTYRLIDESRRDSGELVPREDVLRLVKELQQGYYFALLEWQKLCPKLVGLRSPHDVWKILGQLASQVHAAVASHLSGTHRRVPVPPWLVKAYQTNDYAGGAKGEEQCEKYFAAVKWAMEFLADKTRTEIDGGAAEQKAATKSE
jgi:hypothetical protein